jgi:hypothetical protein
MIPYGPVGYYQSIGEAYSRDVGIYVPDNTGS